MWPKAVEYLHLEDEIQICRIKCHLRIFSPENAIKKQRLLPAALRALHGVSGDNRSSDGCDESAGRHGGRGL